MPPPAQPAAALQRRRQLILLTQRRTSPSNNRQSSGQRLLPALQLPRSNIPTILGLRHSLDGRLAGGNSLPNRVPVLQDRLGMRPPSVPAPSPAGPSPLGGAAHSLTYRLKIEDCDSEPVGNYDVFDTHHEAILAFHARIADRDPDAESVYVTADDGYGEWVIAAHSFV